MTIAPADTIDRGDQKRPGAAGRVEHALVRVTQLIEHMFSEPVRCVVLPQRVPRALGERFLVQVFEGVAGSARRPAQPIELALIR